MMAKNLLRLLFSLTLTIITVLNVLATVNNIPGDTPLYEVPFLMSHASATGYLGRNDIDLYTNRQQDDETPEDILIAWSKTQIGNITQQLNCGARAFDLHPHLTLNLELAMHHDAVVIEYPFRSVLEEMNDWMSLRSDELIFAQIGPCKSDLRELDELCNEHVKQVLEEMNIPYIDENACVTLETMSLDEAKQMGSILAVSKACVEQNYNPDNVCSGYEYQSTGVSRKFYCWVNLTNPAYPVNRLFEYLDTTVEQQLHHQLWLAQAHWQIQPESVLVGGSHGSSILADTLYSRINRFVFGNLTTQRWNDGFNFLAVDYVCDQGNNIALALTDDSIALEDYPDDVVIHNTGIHDSILRGESVLFPDVPPNFVAEVFQDTVAIRRHHENVRFGNTNDIYDLIMAENEDKRQEYLVGVLGSFMVMAGVFVFWACLLLYLKLSRRLDWLVPKTPNDEPECMPEDESSRDDFGDHTTGVKPRCFRKICIGTNMTRIRVAVLLAGVFLLVFSGLLIGSGFKAVADMLDSTALPEIRSLLANANHATDDFLIQANQTGEAARNCFNAVLNNCVFTDNSLGNVTGINETEIVKNAERILIELSEAIRGPPLLVPEITFINQSLTDVQGILLDAEDQVDKVGHAYLFPIATAFVLLIDIMTIVFQVGVLLAWKKQMPRLFNDCTSKVAVPLYMLLIFVAYLLSGLATTGATLTADFCIDTPDNQVLRLMPVDPPFDEFLEYYIRGCGKRVRPELLVDAFKASEILILSINDLLTDLYNLDRNSVPCNSTSFVFATIGDLQQEYNGYVDILYRVSQEMNCAKINPVYTLIAYQTTCINGFDSFRYIFGYFLGLSLCGMAIVTLRVAFYEVDDGQDGARTCSVRSREGKEHAQEVDEGVEEMEEAHPESVSKASCSGHGLVAVNMRNSSS